DGDGEEDDDQLVVQYDVDDALKHGADSFPAQCWWPPKAPLVSSALIEMALRSTMISPAVRPPRICTPVSSPWPTATGRGLMPSASCTNTTVRSSKLIRAVRGTHRSTGCSSMATTPEMNWPGFQRPSGLSTTTRASPVRVLSS